MRKYPIALTLATACLFACNKKSDPDTDSASVEQLPADSAPAQPGADEAFAPPADGLLTEEQVRRFLLAHEALGKVNAIYLDKLATASPEQAKTIQAAMALAGEKSARKFGLKGFAEFRWILEDAPKLPANVELLKKMKVSVVAP